MRYVLTDTWRLLREFDRDVQGVPQRKSQRRLVLLAAYCGSPASDTAAAIDAPSAVVHQVGTGHAGLEHWRDVDRLHDWVQACIWRHLWRTGSGPACEVASIAEARVLAASVCEVPRVWMRDWLVAASEVGA